MPSRSGLGCLLFLVLLGATWWFGRGYVRDHPEQFPWTALALSDPVGPFTRAKLAGLTDDAAQCRALLAAVEPAHRPVMLKQLTEPACAFDDATLVVPQDNEAVRFTPALTTACPVAAGLHLWLRETVQPAARAHLGTAVARIETFGSYSCRRRYSRPDAPWSEHATGDAVDIAAFVLTDGRRLSVLDEWPDHGPAARFLHASRDGACDLFTTVLSPDYNAAHRDHLHLDMAEGGARGWNMCR